MQEDDQVAFELPIKLLLVAEGDHTKALYRDPHDFPNATKLSEAGQQIIANMANLYQSVLADLQKNSPPSSIPERREFSLFNMETSSQTGEAITE